MIGKIMMMRVAFTCIGCGSKIRNLDSYKGEFRLLSMESMQGYTADDVAIRITCPVCYTSNWIVLENGE